jgi:hypothetical protein
VKNRQSDPDAIIKLLVLQDRGEFVLEISASWKVTFGAVNPGGQMSGRDLHCLRVYEGEKLRAVFCDVRGFRDLAIPLARKVTKETGSAEWTMDSAGNFDRHEKRAIESTVEPEEIPF